MILKKLIKRAVQPFRSWLVGQVRILLEQNHQLTGRLASWQVRSMTVISSLSDVEFKVSSQWGEDGIIDWLIERAGIPPESRTFVEFGVESYREANTRFLLRNRNWRGLIMDGGEEMVQAVRDDGLYLAHDLTVSSAFLTRDNINDLISAAGFRGEIGLLSIDVDGNDYWIWEAIEVIQPIICICEYNAIFGDMHPISVPYSATFHRTAAHYSNLYFGASIGALRSLAARKGYRFAGTTSAANDAFFVREDYAQRFLNTSVENIRALPSFFRDSKDQSGRLTYLGGLERLRHISSLPVVNVETGIIAKLADLNPIYSQEWLEMMGNATGM
jgi:hypothetical protein